MSWSLVAFIAANFVAATSGGIFSPDEWFRRLKKPSWQPPNWVFPVVWSILYAINAFAGWLVWEEVGFQGPGFWAMIVYALALVLNAGWSAVFFGLKRLGLATFECVLLWLTIALQIVLFLPISQLAGWILAPYLIWVTIATALSATVWRLNPDPQSAS